VEVHCCWHYEVVVEKSVEMVPVELDLRKPLGTRNPKINWN